MFLKKLHILAFVVAVIALPSMVSAHAQEGEGSSTTMQGTTSKAINERVERRKAELKTRLDRATETRLKARCKAAQVLLTKTHGRSDEAKSRRLKAYNNLLTRLTRIVEKLKSENVDTTELEALQTELATKVEALRVAIDSYHVALNDTSLVDCTTDPTGFKASLDNSRTLNQELGGYYKDIRTLIKDKIIPTVNDLKT